MDTNDAMNLLAVARLAASSSRLKEIAGSIICESDKLHTVGVVCKKPFEPIAFNVD